jgi:pimeloyl-ACP methyl ester carboxylesterase
MSPQLLPGITARTIATGRLSTRVLFSGPEDGTPVLFLHGNLSSATWWR